MANVLFTRKDAPTLSASQSIPVQDGQLIFDTSGSGKMYMDVGSSRLEMGGAMTIDDKLNSTSTNPIQNKAVGGVMLSTLDEINTATSKGFITDALATRALAQKIGTTDISAIGDGTCTGAISALNSSKILWDMVSEAFTADTQSDRRVNISTSRFTKIKSSNSIIMVCAYASVDNDIKASWETNNVTVLIKKQSVQTDFQANIVVFYY